MRLKQIIKLGLIVSSIFLIGGCTKIEPVLDPIEEQVDEAKEEQVRMDHKLINAHEHIQSVWNAEKLLEANKKVGIVKTLLAGSPEETILFDGRTTFTKYDENNDVILEIIRQHPDEFYAFCTLYWNDEKQIEKIQNCMARGATGIKLYNGHGHFYELPLNHENMQPVYAYAEANNIPILFHVNGRQYLEEFKDVLDTHPNLKVVCPHFCLLSGKLPTLKALLNDYPNLYIDTSFGYIDYMDDGFTRISEAPDLYKDFFITYQDSILFGTDAVITNVRFKDAEWLANMFQAYRDLLEKKEFDLNVQKPKVLNIKYNGLNLPDEVLEKIYYKNFINFVGENEVEIQDIEENFTPVLNLE